MQLFAKKWVLPVLLVLLAPLVGRAAGEAAAPVVPPVSPAKPRVSKATVVGDHGQEDQGLHRGDTIVLDIKDLTEWRGPDRKSKLVLYLDGIPFTNSEVPTSLKDQAEFRLPRTSGAVADSASWNRLLASPTGFTKSVTVEAGPDGQALFPTGTEDSKPAPARLMLTVRVMDAFHFGCFLFFLFLLLGSTVALVMQSQALVDPGSHLYSLSRFQLLFWFVLILASYLFIWMATGAINTFNSGVVSILGLSTITSSMAAAIGSRMNSATSWAGSFFPPVAGSASAGGASYNTPVASAPLPPGAPASQGTLLPATTQATLNASVSSTSGVMRGLLDPTATPAPPVVEPSPGAAFPASPPPPPSPDKPRKPPLKNLLTDIISDENGIALYRLQCFIWTLIFGGAFVVAVYQDLSMPDLSPSFLSLMGLSSGAYLLGKSTEPPKAPTPAPPTTPPPA